MYQSLLTRRYLFSKVMPLLASLSVMLCTAMVLITWSVMGGFSKQLLSVGRTMIGDVSIVWPVIGIPHYEDLIKTLEADPKVAAATPVIEALGLVAMPGPPGTAAVEPRMVQVIGVEPDGYNRVTGYYDRLWWKHLDVPLKKDSGRNDLRLKIPAESRIESDGRTLTKLDVRTGIMRPAMVIGTEVTGYNHRNPKGFLEPWSDEMFGPSQEFTLSVLPLSQKGVAIATQDRKFPVANEFRTGVYEVDEKTVIIPLSVAQKMLKLDAAQKIDPATRNGTIVKDASGREQVLPPKVIGVEPARVTTIMIRAKEGVTADELESHVRDLYTKFAEAPERASDMPPSSRILIFTWERKPGLKTFIAAVKKETGLVLILFSFISMTAAFLVLSIFWNMVSEKTKDTGVLRAMGAGRAGIAWLWIRYAMAIGVVGSALGGTVAYLIVTNINPIHEWMGRSLGVMIWDPSVYYFTEVPHEVDTAHATIVLVSGVLVCVLGAVVPAMRAAWMDPVKALRFE